MQDLSYRFVHSCDDIKDLERGIHFDPILLLKKTDSNRLQYEQAFRYLTERF